MFLQTVRVTKPDPLKFMGYELGSVTTFKHDGNECLCIINGEFTGEKMRTVLDKFINKYICCSKCKLPEIVLKVEGGKIKGDCKSCGNNSLLDNKHRMASYIVKSSVTTGEVTKKKGKQGDKGGQVSEAEEKKVTKKRVKKVRAFSDPAIKAFRDKLKEKNYPMSDKDETVAELLKTYVAVFQRNREEEGATKKRNVQRAYRNLKVLKIPLEKQSMYGYLLFNSLFSMNIANQIEKEAGVLSNLYEVGCSNRSEVTEVLRCNTK